MSDTTFLISGGFFDAVDSDRLYSADQMNQPYKKLIHDGINREADGTTPGFAVTAGGGMNVLVATGNAMIGGKWAENKAVQTIAVAGNTSGSARIDSIILQCDKSRAVRAVQIVYRQGTTAAPDLVSDDDITELRLANIRVPSAASAIASENITDTRGGAECPWVRSVFDAPDARYIVEEYTGSELAGAYQTVKSAVDSIRYAAQSGQPTVALQASDMIDSNLVYLYQGSETGYSTGYLYYYSDAAGAWIRGAQYGASVVDTALDEDSENPVQNKAIAVAIKTVRSFVVEVPGSAAAFSGSIATGDFSKALATYTAGSGVYAVKDGEVYQLSAASSSTMTFTQMYHGTMNFIKQIQITSADTFTVTNTALSSSAADTSYNNTTSGLTATDVQAAIDENAAAVTNVNGRLREQEKLVYANGTTVDVSIQNGTLANASNKDCVCTSHIPCVNGKFVTIFPVREAPTGCKYRFAYRIYDSDGNVLKANESPYSEDLQMAYIGYTNAASIRFVISLYDTVNEKSVSLRADTYGALPYAVVYSDTVKNMSEDVAFAINAIEKPMVFVNGKNIYLTSGGELTASNSTVDMSTLPAPCDSGETMYVVPNKNFKVTLFVRVSGVWSVAVLNAESKFSFTFTDEEVYLLRGKKIGGTVLESDIPFKVYATVGTELNKITSRIDSGRDWRVGGPALEDEVNRYISNGQIATSTHTDRASIPPFVPPSRTLRFEMMGDNKYALFVNVGGTWSVSASVGGTKTQTINLDSDVEQICIQFMKSPIKNLITDSAIQTKVLFDYSTTVEDDNDYSDVIHTEDISDTISWSIGGIGSDGADWSRPYAIRSTYIPVVKTISLNSDYVAWCSFYDENHQFIRRIQNLNGDVTVKDVFAGEYTYLRLEVIYAPNGTVDTTPVTDTSRSEHVRLYKTVVDVDAESVWKKYDCKRYEDLISQSKYAYDSNGRVLTLLHFSDIHNDFTGMKFALDVYDSLSHKIDDIIHTGDTVIANYSDGISNWIQSGCADRVLNVIGNHDTEENLVLQAAGKDNVYNTFFAPYISNWGVVQPTNVDTSGSADYHALYYYKDYNTPKIRLIVLDTNFWDSAQSAWLTGTLASAKEDGYAVILACHNVKKLTEMTDSNFSCYKGDGITENTNSYANQPDNWLDPVADFMDAGGEVICMLAGHNHSGHMGYLTLYPDIFCYVSDKGSVARTSGAARISGENNANTVNIVTVNATEKLFKIVKIGAEVDGKMRGRHVFCYDYANKRIVSQW